VVERVKGGRMFFKKKFVTVGLDIGSSLIKIVELERTPKGTFLSNYGIGELLPEAIVEGEIMDRDSVIESIKTLFNVRKIRESDVVTAVSGRGVIVKRILMEKMKESEARERIQWEAEQYVPFDIVDVTLDFQILNPNIAPDQMEVLLVAVKNETINAHIDLIQGAGLNPVIIDVAFFALQNCFEVNYDIPAGEIVALVNIGAELTNINLVKDGIPYFTRDLNIATNVCGQLFRKNLGLNFEQAITLLKGESLEGVDGATMASVLQTFNHDFAAGIERTFSFLESTGETKKVSKIILSGGGSTIPGLADFLSHHFEIPTEIFNPLQRIQYDSVLFGLAGPKKVAPLLTLGVGLALREF